MIDEAFRILAEIGLSEVPPILADQAISQGAHWDSRGRLCFPRELVQSQLDGAAKFVTYYGREAQHDVTLGGDRVFLAPAALRCKPWTWAPKVIVHQRCVICMISRD